MRDGLALEFRTARLALLNADEQLYRHSLTRAQGMLEAEFAVGSELVASSISTLGELLEVEFNPALPGLVPGVAELFVQIDE